MIYGKIKLMFQTTNQPFFLGGISDISKNPSHDSEQRTAVVSCLKAQFQEFGASSCHDFSERDLALNFHTVNWSTSGRWWLKDDNINHKSAI